MGTLIVILILVVIGLGAVKGTLKRILHGSACCGERNAPEKKIKVADKNKSHYSHEYELLVDGMHCSNCVRHVENALNSIDGIWAKANLEQKKVTVLSKTVRDISEFEKAVSNAGYTVLSVKEK